MEIPKTPATILSKLVSPDKSGIWNMAWRRFFDIYHAPIKVMVGNSFYKRGWYGTPGHVIDEVVCDVVVSLNKIFAKNSYSPKISRFRFLLKTVCDRRAVDYIRRNSQSLKTNSIDNRDECTFELAETISAEAEIVKYAEEEIRAFKQSLILDTYMSIRHNYDSQTCAAFEMIKLEDADVDTVIKELGISQNVVNNAVYRIMKKLKQIISSDEKFKELYK